MLVFMLNSLLATANLFLYLTLGHHAISLAAAVFLGSIALFSFAKATSVR